MQAYFELLRDQAIAARDRGNYPVSSALVVRQGGVEIVFAAQNTVFGANDPLGHAELNAIRMAGAFAAGELGDDDAVTVRVAPDGPDETVLYTTIEPCPMCSVGIINAGIHRVVIATEDPPSGSMHPERLPSLPQMWHDLRQANGLTVVFCQTDDPGDHETYISPELHRQLLETFLESREPLDRRLAAGGALDTAAIGARAAAGA